MVILALVGCGGVNPVPNSVRGLQVVAIETIPPEPSPIEGLRLRAWVADGLGRGADVIVWSCAPYEGRCVEAFPPGSSGLPLSIWARAGSIDSPTFTTDVAWPLFASIANDNFELPEEVRGKILVWALACAPGVCPLVDQVLADPVSGSEAWNAAAHALANPQEWIDDLPRGQVSLASKIVPVNLESEDTGFTGYLPTGTGFTGQAPPNQSPIILPLGDPGTVAVPTTTVDYGYGYSYTDGGYYSTGTTTDPDEFLVDRFRIYDPDGDTPLSVRAFVTAGGVYTARPSDTGVAVTWLEPISPLHHPTGFLVVEDGRGGTAVWTDAPSTNQDCEGWEVKPGTEARPIQQGAGLTLRHYAYGLMVTVDAVGSGPSGNVGLAVRLLDIEAGQLLGTGQAGAQVDWDAGTCGGSWRQVPIYLTQDDVCRLGGKLVDLEFTSVPLDDVGGAQATVRGVLKLAPDEPCSQ